MDRVDSVFLNLGSKTAKVQLRYNYLQYLQATSLSTNLELHPLSISLHISILL